MTSFFEKSKEIEDGDVIEHIFYRGSEFIYKTNAVVYDIAPNGGCILLSYPLNQELNLMEIDKKLQNIIAVHRPDGRRICRINSKEVISANFLPDERILKVYTHGKFGVLNPFDEQTAANTELTVDFPHKNKFTPMGEYKGIKFVKVYQSSFVVFTNSKHLVYFYELENIKTKKILEPEPEYTFDEFSSNGLVFYTKPYGKVVYFFIACLKVGLLALEFGGPSVIKKEKILQHVPDQMVQVSMNHKKSLLGILSINCKLFVFATANMSMNKQFNLGFSEIEMRSFNSIEWLEEQVVVLCFQRAFYFIYNGLEKPVLITGFSSGLNIDKTSILLYATEVDGLRVIKMHIKETPNILIRLKSKAYNEVTNMISASPGRLLFEYYKNVQKKVLPENDSIMQNKKLLKKAIEEIEEAAKFELREKQQRKFLMAMCEGKIYLSEQDIDHNIIHNLCKSIKIYTALSRKTYRAISFYQLENIILKDLKTIIQFLINCAEYELAYYFCIDTSKEQEYVTDIFKRWVVDLIKKNNNDLRIGHKIVKSYEKLVQLNKKIESTILIHAAYQAIDLKRQEIAKFLLEKPNPALLKIALYINLGDLNKALIESLKTHDSDSIYAVLGKIVEHQKNNAVATIVKLKDPVINEHFYRYIAANTNPFMMEEFLQKCLDSKFYLIKKMQYEIVDRQYKNFKTKGEKIKDLVNWANNLHITEKKTPLAAFLTVNQLIDVGIKNHSNEPGTFNPTAENIMQKYFDKNKVAYLEQPDSGFDKEFKDRAKDLGLNEKRQVLMRIDYMLKNSQTSNLDVLIKYISKQDKQNFSLLQLKLLFDNSNHSDEFLSVLELYPYSEAYSFADQRQLFYEAASLSITANKKQDFGNAIQKVRDQKKKEKLISDAKRVFK